MILRAGRALLAAGLLALACARPARAASSSTVNISVQISASLSVTVDAAATSTQAVTWSASVPNQALASASTATVSNDTGGRTEKWALATNAATIDLGGASPGAWSLAASTAAVGPDQVAVQAVFGSSRTASGGCPSAASADWNGSFAPPLTAAPVTYTSTVFADPALNNAGTPLPDGTSGGSDGHMFAGSRRALCWRIITPSSTSTTDTQNIQIIVTATP